MEAPAPPETVPLWKEWVSTLRLFSLYNLALEVEEPPILSANPETPSLATQLQAWRQPALKGCFLEQTTPLPGDDGA